MKYTIVEGKIVFTKQWIKNSLLEEFFNKHFTGWSWSPKDKIICEWFWLPSDQYEELQRALCSETTQVHISYSRYWYDADMILPCKEDSETSSIVDVRSSLHSSSTENIFLTYLKKWNHPSSNGNSIRWWSPRMSSYRSEL